MCALSEISMKIRHRNRQERWPDTLPEPVLIVVLVLGPLLGSMLLFFGIWLLTVLPSVAIWVLLFGVLCLAYGIMGIQTAMAVFSFSSDGVHVKYPIEKERYYPWSAFQQVCVCYYSRATEMNGYPLICLVRKGEKTDRFGRWKTGSVLHYRNLLCLDYSEEQLAHVAAYCPYPVQDLRGQGNYRL